MRTMLSTLHSESLSSLEMEVKNWIGRKLFENEWIAKLHLKRKRVRDTPAYLAKVHVVDIEQCDSDDSVTWSRRYRGDSDTVQLFCTSRTTLWIDCTVKIDAVLLSWRKCWEFVSLSVCGTFCSWVSYYTGWILFAYQFSNNLIDNLTW